MYIWVGIDVDEQLSDIKSTAQLIEQSIGFHNSSFTLPLHISLKISFEIDDADFEGVVSTISDYYLSITPFEIEIKGLEKENNIIWIRMVKSKHLDKLHNDLNNMLLKKYGVGLHKYDIDYKYHVTLFMGDDASKTEIAYEMIKREALPKKLYAKKFLIGKSEAGGVGTYSVYKKTVVENKS